MQYNVDESVDGLIWGNIPKFTQGTEEYHDKPQSEWS
jgi:hypothetical protein